MYAPTVAVSIIPLATGVTVPEASVAVAPASVYEDPSSTVAGLLPVTVTTGAVVSWTTTVLVAVPTLPHESVAEYEIVYVPTELVSTEPDEETVSPVSAVAPASEYDVPSSTNAGLAPLTVITGAVPSFSLSSKRLLPRANIATAPKALSIIESSVEIKPILSEIVLSLAGLCEDSFSSSRSWASANNWAFLAFNWKAGKSFTLFSISRICFWDNAASWETASTESKENTAINVAKNVVLFFIILTVVLINKKFPHNL